MKLRATTAGCSGWTKGRLALLTGLIVAAFLAALTWPAKPHAQVSDPGGFIADLGQRLITILHSEAPAAEREERLQTLLRTSLDLDILARFALGPHWRRATAEQRAAFQAAFEDHLVQTYAQRLAGERIAAFSITAVSELAPAEHFVGMTVVRDGHAPLPLRWRVRQRAGEYRIVDLIVHGISLAVTQRSDLMAVAQRQGIEALITALEGATR